MSLDQLGGTLHKGKRVVHAADALGLAELCPAIVGKVRGSGYVPSSAQMIPVVPHGRLVVPIKGYKRRGRRRRRRKIKRPKENEARFYSSSAKKGFLLFFIFFICKLSKPTKVEVHSRIMLPKSALPMWCVA